MRISGLSNERREHLAAYLRGGLVPQIPAEFNEFLNVYDLKFIAEGSNGFITFSFVVEELQDVQSILQSYVFDIAGIVEK